MSRNTGRQRDKRREDNETDTERGRKGWGERGRRRGKRKIG